MVSGAELIVAVFVCVVIAGGFAAPVIQSNVFEKKSSWLLNNHISYAEITTVFDDEVFLIDSVACHPHNCNPADYSVTCLCDYSNPDPSICGATPSVGCPPCPRRAELCLPPAGTYDGGTNWTYIPRGDFPSQIGDPPTNSFIVNVPPSGAELRFFMGNPCDDSRTLLIESFDGGVMAFISRSNPRPTRLDTDWWIGDVAKERTYNARYSFCSREAKVTPGTYFVNVVPRAATDLLKNKPSTIAVRVTSYRSPIPPEVSPATPMVSGQLIPDRITYADIVYVPSLPTTSRSLGFIITDGFLPPSLGALRGTLVFWIEGAVAAVQYDGDPDELNFSVNPPRQRITSPYYGDGRLVINNVGQYKQQGRGTARLFSTSKSAVTVRLYASFITDRLAPNLFFPRSLDVRDSSTPLALRAALRGSYGLRCPTVAPSEMYCYAEPETTWKGECYFTPVVPELDIHPWDIIPDGISGRQPTLRMALPRVDRPSPVYLNRTLKSIIIMSRETPTKARIREFAISESELTQCHFLFIGGRNVIVNRNLESVNVTINPFLVPAPRRDCNFTAFSESVEQVNRNADLLRTKVLESNKTSMVELISLRAQLDTAFSNSEIQACLSFTDNLLSSTTQDLPLGPSQCPFELGTDIVTSHEYNTIYDENACCGIEGLSINCCAASGTFQAEVEAANENAIQQSQCRNSQCVASFTRDLASLRDQTQACVASGQPWHQIRYDETAWYRNCVTSVFGLMQEDSFSIRGNPVLTGIASKACNNNTDCSSDGTAYCNLSSRRCTRGRMNLLEDQFLDCIEANAPAPFLNRISAPDVGLNTSTVGWGRRARAQLSVLQDTCSMDYGIGVNIREHARLDSSQAMFPLLASRCQLSCLDSLCEIPFRDCLPSVANWHDVPGLNTNECAAAGQVCNHNSTCESPSCCTGTFCGVCTDGSGDLPFTQNGMCVDVDPVHCPTPTTTTLGCLLPDGTFNSAITDPVQCYNAGTCSVQVRDRYDCASYFNISSVCEFPSSRSACTSLPGGGTYDGFTRNCSAPLDSADCISRGGTAFTCQQLSHEQCVDCSGGVASCPVPQAALGCRPVVIFRDAANPTECTTDAGKCSSDDYFRSSEAVGIDQGICAGIDFPMNSIACEALASDDGSGTILPHFATPSGCSSVIYPPNRACVIDVGFQVQQRYVAFFRADRISTLLKNRNSTFQYWALNQSECERPFGCANDISMWNTELFLGFSAEPQIGKERSECIACGGQPQSLYEWTPGLWVGGVLVNVTQQNAALLTRTSMTRNTLDFRRISELVGETAGNFVAMNLLRDSKCVYDSVLPALSVLACECGMGRPDDSSLCYDTNALQPAGSAVACFSFATEYEFRGMKVLLSNSSLLPGNCQLLDLSILPRETIRQFHTEQKFSTMLSGETVKPNEFDLINKNGALVATILADGGQVAPANTSQLVSFTLCFQIDVTDAGRMSDTFPHLDFVDGSGMFLFLERVVISSGRACGTIDMSNPRIRAMQSNMRFIPVLRVENPDTEEVEVLSTSQRGLLVLGIVVYAIVCTFCAYRLVHVFNERAFPPKVLGVAFVLTCLLRIIQLALTLSEKITSQDEIETVILEQLPAIAYSSGFGAIVASWAGVVIQSQSQRASNKLILAFVRYSGVVVFVVLVVAGAIAIALYSAADGAVSATVPICGARGGTITDSPGSDREDIAIGYSVFVAVVGLLFVALFLGFGGRLVHQLRKLQKRTQRSGSSSVGEKIFYIAAVGALSFLASAIVRVALLVSEGTSGVTFGIIALLLVEAFPMTFIMRRFGESTSSKRGGAGGTTSTTKGTSTDSASSSSVGNSSSSAALSSMSSNSSASGGSDADSSAYDDDDDDGGY